MFHVKPKIRLYNQQCRIIILLIIISFSNHCFSQKEKDFTIGLGNDVRFGRDCNNFATSIRISYNILDKVRIVPAYSHYLKKGSKKMSSFSFDFNYLLTSYSSKIFSRIEKQTFILYPIVGFYIIEYYNPRKVCKACTSVISSDTNYQSNFGFNIGTGIEYKLPGNSKFCSNTSLFFEFKYGLVENFSRPFIALGLFYNLKKSNFVSRGTQK